MPPSLLAVALAVLTLLVGCLGGDFEQDVGFPCYQSVECRSGLECQYGRCRETCTRDADCSPQGACIASLLDDNSHDPTRRVCTHRSEAECHTTDDCPAFLRCSPDGICRERCDDVELLCGPGHECLLEPGVCLESTSG